MPKKQYSDAQKQKFKEKNEKNLNNFVHQVSKELLDIIEQGKSQKWVKPWKSIGGMPINAVSDRNYTNTNNFILMADMIKNGRADNRYCTFKQSQQIAKQNKMEIHVKEEEKGKGVPILVPVFVKGKTKKTEKEESPTDLNDEISNTEQNETKDKGDNEERIPQKLVGWRISYVYNSDQFTDFPESEQKQNLEKKWEEWPEIENLVQVSGVNYKKVEQDRAAYVSSTDTILMPIPEAFDEQEHYYATLLHEFYHSTMHENRDNRKDDASGSFGTPEYALEEVRAEAFSLLAGYYLNLPIPIEQHAGYIEGWNRVLEDNPKEIEKEIAKAAKMFDQVFVPHMQGEKAKAQWFRDLQELQTDTEEEEVFSPAM